MISNSPLVTSSEEVAALLREQIRTGDLPPGAKIPTARELAQRYDVSGHTAITAVRDLATEGIVETRRGKGSFVLRTPRLLRYGSDRYRRNDGEPTSPNLSEGEDSGWSVRIAGELDPEVYASADVAQRLAIDPGESVSQIRYYMRSETGELVQISTQWEPMRIVRGTSAEEPPATGVPDVITRMDAIGWPVTTVVERSEPRLPSVEESRLLGMAQHTPVLDIHRTHYANDTPVETATIVIRGDRVTTVTVHHVD